MQPRIQHRNWWAPPAGPTCASDNEAVFETWSDTSNLFPDAEEFANNDPPATLPAFGAANQLVPRACSDLPDYQPHYKLLDQASKSDDSFSEGAPLVDANGNYVRYEVLLNETLWDHVVDNDLQTAEGQNAAGEVTMPCGVDKASWSVIVKAAWKRLDVAAGDDASKFHVRTSAVYTPASNNSTGVESC